MSRCLPRTAGRGPGIPPSSPLVGPSSSCGPVRRVPGKGATAWTGSRRPGVGRGGQSGRRRGDLGERARQRQPARAGRGGDAGRSDLRIGGDDRGVDRRADARRPPSRGRAPATPPAHRRSLRPASVACPRVPPHRARRVASRAPTRTSLIAGGSRRYQSARRRHQPPALLYLSPRRSRILCGRQGGTGTRGVPASAASPYGRLDRRAGPVARPTRPDGA